MTNDYKKDLVELAEKQHLEPPKITKAVIKEATSDGEPQVCDKCGKHYLTNEKTYYLTDKYYLKGKFLHFCSKKCNDEMLEEMKKAAIKSGVDVRVWQWQKKPKP